MMRNSFASRYFSVSALVCLFGLLAGPSIGDGAEIVPDFALLDVNPTSTTYDQMVSPRDYLGQVSAWYFGVSS